MTIWFLGGRRMIPFEILYDLFSIFFEGIMVFLEDCKKGLSQIVIIRLQQSY